MRVEEVMKRAINKVKKIFQKHYGVEFDFQWIENSVKNEYLLWNKYGKPFVYFPSLKEVCFPVFNSKKRLEALATVKPIFREDQVCFNEMAEFINLAVVEPLQLNETRQRQNQREDILKRLSADPEKVISLKRKLPVDCEIETGKLEFTGKKNFNPIWIAGDSSRLNIRIAFSIHELSSNWAFINTREVPDLVWEDPKVWNNLPQVTILISDIEFLSDSKVAYLHESLKFMKNLKEKPLLIVTSSHFVPKTLEKLKSFFRSYDSNMENSISGQARDIFCQHQNFRCEKKDEQINKGLCLVYTHRV